MKPVLKKLLIMIFMVSKQEWIIKSLFKLSIHILNCYKRNSKQLVEPYSSKHFTLSLGTNFGLCRQTGRQAVDYMNMHLVDYFMLN